MNDDFKKRIDALKQPAPANNPPEVPPPTGPKNDSPPPPAPSSADLTKAKLIDITGQLAQTINGFDKSIRALEQRLAKLPAEIQGANQPLRAEFIAAKGALTAINAQLDGLNIAVQSQDSVARDGFARNHIVGGLTVFLVFAVLCCIVLK